MTSELEKLIDIALCKLYCKDKYLIVHKPCNEINTTPRNGKTYVSERAIVFRFGIYLQELVYLSEDFKDYHIDVEYNRNLNNVKCLPKSQWEKGAYPDLIIHKRGSNDSNLLVVEFKAWWSDASLEKNDREKLERFKKPPYNYSYALFIKIKEEKPEWDWIELNSM
jgi:hypothetical protein